MRNITVLTTDLTHLGWATFSVELSDFGPIDALPASITVKNLKTGGQRQYRLERASRDREGEIEKWLYESAEGGTIHVFND